MSNSTKPLVSVIMGSKSDWSGVMEQVCIVLDDLGIPNEAKVMSAHRTPEFAADHASSARDRGVEVIVAGAGCAAHLAGVVAAHTPLPVIGVPVSSPDLKGLDSLLSTVQMPGGIPVATVAIGRAGAKNAGLLAASILALKYPEIAEKYDAFRAAQTAKGIENSDPRA
ncbi:MAG: 5-(carboxyamino)imidazole ribonucleotide mutase [Phycisphaerales bacterium]|nr:5-(carboxyamino)imidazole ribonucleotide mutase [Phycisphaerales bacterium]